MIKKLYENVKFPKKAKLENLSDEQLKALLHETRQKLDEVDFEHRARERRVGDSPELKGKDVAMAAVSDAYRNRMLASKENEQIILQYPEATYYYVTRVLRERWLEGEKTIRTNPKWWSKYKEFVKSLPKEKQSLSETMAIVEDSNIKNSLISEFSNVEWLLKSLEAKMTDNHMIRKVKALRGDFSERYEFTLDHIKKAINELEQLNKFVSQHDR